MTPYIYSHDIYRYVFNFSLIKRYKFRYLCYKCLHKAKLLLKTIKRVIHFGQKNDR